MALAASLRAAVKGGDLQAVEEALRAGASPDTLLTLGGTRTLLAHAIETGCTGAALLLLSAGASPTSSAPAAGGSPRHCPWNIALEKSDTPMFLECLRRDPRLGSPWFGIPGGVANPSPAPLDPHVNPWLSAANYRNREVLGVLAERAHRDGEMLPAPLVPVLARALGGLPDSPGLLSAVKALSPFPRQFVEHVAFGACHWATLSSARERSTRAARAWALEHGASFFDLPVAASNGSSSRPAHTALSMLPRFPFDAEGGLSRWLEARASTCPIQHLHDLLAFTVENASVRPFRATWDVLEERRRTEPSPPLAPFLHDAVAAVFRCASTDRAGLAFLRAVLAVQPVTLKDAQGNTALHRALAIGRAARMRPVTSARMGRLLDDVVALLVGKGASWQTKNDEGVSAMELAFSMELPPAVLARVEAASLEMEMARAPGRRPRRQRL